MCLFRMRLSQTLRLSFALVLAGFIQSCATSGAIDIARDQFRQGSAENHVSIRDQTASIIINDSMSRYRGEFSEQLWLHTFQMINYLLSNKPIGAAVEARRAAALIEEHPKILKHDKFTRMLMATSFESANQHDSANVEYRRLAEDFDYAIPTDLPSDHGEVIAIIAGGFIEPKLAGNLYINYESRISFPYYANHGNYKPDISVQINGADQLFSQVDTHLASVSQQALDKRGKAIAVRQALRFAAKQNLANSIEDKDEITGGIARLLLFALEQADTRSWETLPSSISLIRIPVKTGPQTISLVSSDENLDTVTREPNHLFNVNLKEDERVFKFIRTNIAKH